MRNTYLWTCAFAIIVLIQSCRNDEDNLASPKTETYLTEAQMEKMIKIGRKLENPYSVENMKIAWRNLTQNNENARGFSNQLEIVTTHYYVKFTPKTETEMGILKLDSSLILFDYPLDVELEEGGTFYHDPSIPVGQPTPQYASVKVDYKFPSGVTYEILSDLFIPDEAYEGQENQFARVTSNQIIKDLVTEALRITNNLDEFSDGRVEGPCNGGSFRPAGRMRVFDPTLSSSSSKIYVPVHDVEVRANRWFTTYTDKTNSNGEYSVNGTFDRPCDYSLKWEKYNFELREEGGGTPQDYKNDVCGDWNRDFGNSYEDKDFIKGDHQLYAHVFRAARQYYYGDNKGLRRPPENGTLVSKLQIKAVNGPDPDGDALGNHNVLRRFLGGVDIKVFNDKRTSEQIYGTTIHELAHASHWQMSTWHYINGDTRVYESWARGVQWDLTRVFYPEYRGGASSNNYTQVVVDMIDFPAPFVSGTSIPMNINNGSENLLEDNVEGYTIREIEDALKDKATWQDWEQSITNKIDNPTEQNLPTLFNYWKNY